MRTDGEQVAPRVLFVCHEASLTGAPKVLLTYLTWLSANTDLRFEILALAGGPLLADFSALAPTTVVEARGRSHASYFEAGLVKAGYPQLGDRLKKRRVGRKLRDLTGFDAVYLNSATSALVLRVLPEIPPLIISHVHELDSAFAHWFDEFDRAAMITRTDWFVACADTVARMLTEYGVDPTRISCHHEFIEPPVLGSDGSGGVRAIVDIPEGSFVVGASGQSIWRKGPDLFIQMAAHIVSRHPDLDVHFVWVGSTETDLWALHDIEKMGLSGRVHFVGQIEEPTPMYADFDVFCLTSREDPFPLVMLEMAALGVPVVGFDNGGIVEFAGADECCIVVDYLDVAALGLAVTDLLASPARRSALGEKSGERVRTQHLVDVAAPRLYREMMEHLAAGSGRRGGDVVGRRR